MKKQLTLLLLMAWSYSSLAQLADRDYADLLTKSLQFFNAQASGPDVETYSTFDWRGASHTEDGEIVATGGNNRRYELDLNGGWYDAGDHVKFNYPMGQAVYNVASLYVDHRQQIDNTANKEELLKHLRFIGDYMIKCHPEPNQYVIQVAEGTVDHSFWQVPEENTYERTAFMADIDNPNTNLACANAAAFAALSMAFRGEDEAYSEGLLQHAIELYDFGYNYQASYNKSSTVDGGPLPGNPYLDRATGEFTFYKDNNDFYDEIMVGAAWLYRATQEERYRREAEAAFAELGNYLGEWVHGFGDHQYEAAFQMARVTGEARYLDALDRYVSAMADGTEGTLLDQGRLWVPNNGGGFNLPLSLAGAMTAYRYADLVGSQHPTYDKARAFAFRQINYSLGDNAFNRSFVVDYGNNPPRVTHHRAAHSPNSTLIDSDPDLDTHIITGALVMGPRIQPSGTFDYTDTRSVVPETEPALGNNAVLSVLAALTVEETGATTEPPTPVAQSSYNNDGAPWAVTDGTTLQAEDYDEGGADVAYFDSTPDSNAGQQYRTEGVDIGATAGGANYIGWTEAGEWLEYSVDITEGTYDVQVEMSSPNDERQLRVLIGDSAFTELGVATLASNTGDFETFQTVTIPDVNLSGGEQTLRLEFVNGSFNVDAISFAAPGPETSDEPNSPESPTDEVAQTIVAAHGQLSVEGTKIKDECDRDVQLRGMSYFWHMWDNSHAYMNERVITHLKNDWNVQMVRIPIGGRSGDPCSSFGDATITSSSGCDRAAIGKTGREWAYEVAARSIRAAINAGIYVIIDWHTHDLEVDKARSFFDQLSTEFGQEPNLIYQIFMEQKNTDWPALKSYSEDIIATIRANDPDNLILIPTPFYNQRLDLAAADPVTTDVNGNPVTNAAYVLHFYAGAHRDFVRGNAQAALDAGLAVFTAECGRTGVQFNNPNNPIDQASWNEWMEWSDRNKISWTSWSMSIKNERSSSLQPSASTDPLSNPWDYNNDLTAEGRYKRDFLRSINTLPTACDSTNPDPEPPVSSGRVVVQARGSVGGERMRLLVDEDTVATWTVTTTLAPYTYADYQGGQLRIAFDNDGSPEGQDRNLAVDYLEVCGVQYQAEGSSVDNSATSGCSDTFGDGLVWLWCNASLDFGSVGCSSTARTVAGVDKPETQAGASDWFRSYPNPVAEQLTVEGGQDYGVVVYDLTGQAVMRHDHLGGRAVLDVRHLRPGVYVLKMNDSKNHQLRQRMVVK